MKKFNMVLAMLALVLVFGFTLVSCSDDSTKGGPDVREVNPAFWNGNGYTPATSFTTSSEIGFIIRYSTPNQDMAIMRVTVKKGGEVWLVRTYSWNVSKSDNVYNGTLGSWTFPAGSYTAEAYAEDIDGKRSSTATSSFTVTAAP
jgi:hypothetical protein